METPKYFLIFAMAAILSSFFNYEASAQPAKLRSDAWMTNGQVFDIIHSKGIIYIGGSFTSVAMLTGNGTALNMRTAVPLPLPRVNGTINTVAPDGAGGWYIGGDFNEVDDFVRPRLAHILANGTVDLGWAPKADGLVSTLVLHGTTIYVGGDFTEINGQPRNGIAALDAATGQVITTWIPNANAAVRALAVDGKIVYAGGAFSIIGGLARNGIAALDFATGTATPWNPNLSDGEVFTLEVSGNTVYAGGTFTGIGSDIVETRNNLAAIDAITGNPLPWNPDPDGAVNALKVSGNTVYVGGDFTTIGGRARNSIAAINAMGNSTDWDPDADGPVYSLAINGGAIFVGGSFTSIGSEARRSLAAIDAGNGTALQWNPNVSTSIASSTPSIFALAISGLTVYAGGDFRACGEITRNNIAAFDASTGRPTAWNPNANGTVRALALKGTTVYVGGSFTSIGGAVRNRLAALKEETGNATAWNPNIEGVPAGVPTTTPSEINTIDVEKTTVYVGGLFSSINGQPQLRTNIAALDARTGIVIPWTNPPIPSTPASPSTGGRVRSLVVYDGVIYFGGDFTAIETTSGPTQIRNLLAALDAKTGMLTAWNPNAGGIPSGAPFGTLPAVLALTIKEKTVYAGGRFTMVGGQARNHIVTIDAESGIPTNWNPNIFSTINNIAVFPIRAITISADTVYFGGEFTRIGSEARNNVAAVDADTAIPTVWNPNATGGNPTSISAIEVTEATIFIGGNFNNIVGVAHSFFSPLGGEAPLNPAPTLVSISPTRGTRLQTLKVTFNGTNFIDEVSAVNLGSGIAVNSITVINARRLTANITISANAGTGLRNFSVGNNPPGGGASNAFAFTIDNPAPTLTSVAPTSGLRGQTFDVTVRGLNFISDATSVGFGSDIIINSITVMSAARMIVNITIADNATIGTHDVTVTNAFPGGGTATLARALTVNFPPPALISLTPASGDRLETLDVVFTGTGFINGVTTVNAEPGIKINSTTVTSATSLTANLTIAAHAATGPRAFSVTNTPPFGGTSETQAFTINNPAPTLKKITPASGGRGQTLNVILTGANFFSDASVVSFGEDIVVNSITVTSSTQIVASITIPLDVELGSREIAVTNSSPGGGTETLEEGFDIVNPAPTLISVTPTIGSLKQTLEVTLIGTNFIDGISSLDFGEGIAVNAMTVVSSTQITATITIKNSAPLEAHDVSVTNVEPGGGVATLPKTFAVTDGPLVHFSVPTNLRGAAGDIVEVPLDIDPDSRKVASFDAKLSFDPEIFNYVDFINGPGLEDGDWQVDVNSSANAITIGAFAPSEGTLKEEETAIILFFRVHSAAKPETTVPLVLSNLAATDRNAKALPTERTNGLFTVFSDATISGKLLYFDGKRPIPEATVQLQVSDPASTKGKVSDENGQFEFTGVPLGGNAVLTPRKVSSDFPEGTITAGDALKAFKGRAGGPESLNGYESLAADVTGDCKLTSGDALAILKCATGNWKNFRRFVPEAWRFVDADFDITAENWCASPKSRIYDPLLENKLDQNFIGVLLGDVNGSFGSEIGKTSGHGPSVAIAEPSFVVGSEQFNFTVKVSAGRLYDSFDLTLAFNNENVRVINVQLGSMLVPEDWQMDWNASAPGVLCVAGFSMSETCIKGEGTLLIIQATLARPAANEPFDISIPSALFGVNGEETPAQSETAQLTAKLPQQYALAQNYPNPFSPETPSAQTVIQYALPQAGVVHLQIYDMLGHLVRTLASGHQEAGAHKLIWDGRKDDGSPAATGIYLYRLEAGTFTKTNKLILQK